MKKDFSLAPIAFFAYKRPIHTRKTLESLIKNELAAKSKIYVFLDGPKNNNDKHLNNKVKEIIKSFSSNFLLMEIKHKKKNVGLANNIVDGINQVFNKHKKIIVLEDDIEVSKVFLNYMNDALMKYENEKKVWHISAYIQPFDYTGKKSRFFWKYMNCWGWGTWKNRWEYYFKDPLYLINNFSSEAIRSFNLDGLIQDWDQVILNHNKKIDTWAIFWYATIFIKQGLCLNPINSLTRNIGHDKTGENCGINKELISQDIYNNINNFYPLNIEEDQEIIQIINPYIKVKFLFFKKILFYFENYLPFGYLIIRMLKIIQKLFGLCLSILYKVKSPNLKLK